MAALANVQRICHKAELQQFQATLASKKGYTS
jgi:hypothetical protein